MKTDSAHNPCKESDLKQRLESGIEIAQKAGVKTLKHFYNAELKIDHKLDGSAVTIADKEAETFIRNEMQNLWPKDALLGEEYGKTPGSSKWRWIIDPIDGTESFVRRVPMYGTLIGIEYEGTPIAGIMFFPGTNELVYGGIGLGVSYEGKNDTYITKDTNVSVSNTNDLLNACICTTSYDYFQMEGAPVAFKKFADKTYMTRGWSDCYCEMLVITGRIDAVIEPIVRPWDVAASIPLLLEAGGSYTDWTGAPTNYPYKAIASNGAIHNELVEILTPYSNGDHWEAIDR